MFGGRDVPLQKRKEKIEDMKKGRYLLIVVLLFLLICGLTAQENIFSAACACSTVAASAQNTVLASPMVKQ